MGVLKGRDYEVKLVTSNGGTLKVINEADDHLGIKYLLKNLRDTGEGFLIDEDTFYSYVIERSNMDTDTDTDTDTDVDTYTDTDSDTDSEIKAFSTEERQQLKNGVILTKKHIKGEYSFGMLVRNEAVYRYLLKFVENNLSIMDDCRRNFINYQLAKRHTLDHLDVTHSIFSPEGGLFYPTLKYSCVLLGIVLMFGIGYEIWRKVKRGKNFDSCDQINGGLV